MCDSQVRDAARPILARLVSPDQRGGRSRWLFTDPGALAAFVALTSAAVPAALAVPELATVFLVVWALHGDDRPARQSLAAINGVAMHLLAFGALERLELVARRLREDSVSG
jgi:hypothetical protein